MPEDTAVAQLLNAPDESKPEEPKPEDPANRTYYSVHGYLIININNGNRVTEAGSGLSKIVNQKIVEFTPMADGYGKLITSDPEVIAKLDARMKAPNSDVFTGDEYIRRTTPAELQIQLLQEKVRQMSGDHARVLTDRNRLLEKLNAEGKTKVPDSTPVPLANSASARELREKVDKAEKTGR